MDSFTFSNIGILHSCYKEKFGVPRQPRLVSEVVSELVLSSRYCSDSVRELEQFTHIWLLFIFNQMKDGVWNSLVRPPRLGGNRRIGVFASRSTFRPNPIGMSAVELLKINDDKGKVSLLLRGCDLVDKTPIIDIKPYIPYSDRISEANAGFAEVAPSIVFRVNFTGDAIKQCQSIENILNGQKKSITVDLKKLIEQILQLDPRPSYQRQQVSDRVYAMKLYYFDLKWKYEAMGEVLVLALDEEVHFS
jgi:tRNA-Thr(GGU) m(6)t(6)A37 methyltransferase TsaA